MKAKVTKEWFIKNVNAIEQNLGWLDKLYEAEILSEDFIDKIGFAIEQPVRMLQELMDDEEDWIGYWIFELDCGRKWTPGCVEDKDGDEVKLQTAEDLWNVLTEE